MKVKELIAALWMHNPELEVAIMVRHPDGGWNMATGIQGDISDDGESAVYLTPEEDLIRKEALNWDLTEE